VRLVAWNLLHGGGARVAAIAAELLRHDADVLVLSEYRSARGAELAALLRAGGYEAVVTTDPPPRVNGLAVLAREPVARCPAPPGALTAQRWLEVDLPGRELAVAAVHVPPVISVGEEAKQAFWDLLLAWAAAHQAEPVLLVGDLNTGAPGLDERGATLYCAPSFLALGASGWVVARRHFHGDRRGGATATGSTTRSRRRRSCRGSGPAATSTSRARHASPTTPCSSSSSPRRPRRLTSEPSCEIPGSAGRALVGRLRALAWPDSHVERL
jgi:hypothetical protein